VIHAFRNIEVMLLAASIGCAIGCGAGSSPTAPSGNAGSAGNSAAVAVESVAAVRELIGADTDAYHVSFSLRELTGTAGATIKAMDLTFANGMKATFGPERAPAIRVRPGGTLSVSDLTVTGPVTSRATSVQIEVLLTDDVGRDSASVTAASVTSAYVLSGKITNKASGSPIAGAVVTITFGAASGRRATSDATGAYVLRTIPAGQLSFTVSAPGFATVTRTATIDGNAVIDVGL
jgi:Carboxypeptidase regulatory-like domain